MSPMVPFTGHNIRLPDGTETKPGTPLIAENGITNAARRLLAVCCQRPARVADLGCLEGGYSLAFAMAGWDVLGIEARKANFTRCLHVAREWSEYGVNLEFRHEDARDLATHGEFDAVFCAGLLYHLDEPDAFLQMLGKVTRRLLIVQTHYSARPDAFHEGRAGHWHADNPGDGDPWGSHGNERSFWMAKADLLQAIRAAGFDVVLQQFDYLDDIEAGPQGTATPENPCGGTDRGMFIGIKP